MTNVCRRKQ